MKTALKIQNASIVVLGKHIFLSFVLLCLGIIFAHGQASIEGQWKDMEKGSTFLIYEEDGKYFGQLISSDNPEENTKIQAQDKILIVRNFEKKNDSEFCCGKIFQPRMEKEIPATLMLADENTLKIKVKYRGFKRTREWTRL